MGDKPAKNPKRTWGASHREPYSIIFQAEVICDCRVGSHNLHHKRNMVSIGLLYPSGWGTKTLL